MANTKNQGQDNTARNKKIAIIGLIGIVLYFLLRKTTPTKTVDVTSDFLIDAYRSMITSEQELTYQDEPLYIYLAKNTTDFDAVRLAYKSTYSGASLYQDLFDRLGALKFSVYVAQLWISNKQAVTD